jgi:hypothetical protein
MAVLCFAFAGWSDVFNGGIVGSSTTDQEKLLYITKGELGVREATGNNDGKRVEEYLVSVGLQKGAPYCAAFVSWAFRQAGYANPRTGWSPALFPSGAMVKNPSPGNVFGIYFPGLKRVAHCGFVERVKGSWIYSIEANTNLPGGREGDGVYRRLRHIRTIYCYADWLKADNKMKGGL